MDGTLTLNNRPELGRFSDAHRGRRIPELPMIPMNDLALEVDVVPGVCNNPLASTTMTEPTFVKHEASRSGSARNGSVLGRN